MRKVKKLSSQRFGGIELSGSDVQLAVSGCSHFAGLAHRPAEIQADFKSHYCSQHPDWQISIAVQFCRIGGFITECGDGETQQFPCNQDSGLARFGLANSQQSVVDNLSTPVSKLGQLEWECDFQ